jgi:hypothetical protein
LEREHTDFHRRVAVGYHELAEMIPHILRVDARGSVAEVHRRIVSALHGRLPETFGSFGFISEGQDRSGAPANSDPL